MGEANKKKEAHVEELLMQANILNLYGAEEIIDIPLAELVRVYNGCGPEWLPSAAREKLTEYFAIFEPAFIIHDWRFSRSDGTRCRFNFANFELEQNLRRIAKAKYGFFNWRRYRALAAAKIIAEACSRYGWSAYCAGRMNDEEVRVPSSSSRAEDKNPSSNSNSQLQLKSLLIPLLSLIPHSPIKLSLCLCASVLILLTGCYRSIELVREGEYSLTYTAVGLKTDVSKIEAEKSTNGTVRVFIEGVATDVSERNAKIIESSGTAVGNIAEKVVEGMK